MTQAAIRSVSVARSDRRVHDQFERVLGSRRGRCGGVGRYAELLLGVYTGGPIGLSLRELRGDVSAVSSNHEAGLLIQAVSQRLMAQADERWLAHARELLHLMGVTAQNSGQQVWVIHDPSGARAHLLHLARACKNAWEPALASGGLRLLCGVLPRGPGAVPARLAGRGDWRERAEAGHLFSPAQAMIGPLPPSICPVCYALAPEHYPRDIGESSDYPLFARRGQKNWRTLVGVQLEAHLRQALVGPASECNQRALSGWLSHTYRQALIEGTQREAVALHDHVLRRVAGEDAYEQLLGRFGYGRGGASKPTLWQDLRVWWPVLTDRWLRQATPPSAQEVLASYEQRLREAAGANPSRAHPRRRR